MADRGDQVRLSGVVARGREVSRLQVQGDLKVIGPAAQFDQAAAAFERGTAINPITGSTRTPTTYNLDLGAYYPIQFGERKQLRFQFDMFNVFNNVNYGQPNGIFGSATFGRITSTSSGPRVIQFAFKLNF